MDNTWILTTVTIVGIGVTVAGLLNFDKALLIIGIQTTQLAFLIAIWDK